MSLKEKRHLGIVIRLLILLIILASFKIYARSGCQHSALIFVDLEQIKISFASKTDNRTCIELYRFKYFSLEKSFENIETRSLVSNRAAIQKVKHHLNVFPNISRFIVFNKELIQKNYFLSLKSNLEKVFKAATIEISDKELMLAFEKDFLHTTIHEFKKKRISLLFEKENTLHLKNLNFAQKYKSWKEFKIGGGKQKKPSKYKQATYINNVIEEKEINQATNTLNHSGIYYFIFRPKIFEDPYFLDIKSKYHYIRNKTTKNIKALKKDHTLQSFINETIRSNHYFYRVNWEKYYFTISNLK